MDELNENDNLVNEEVTSKKQNKLGSQPRRTSIVTLFIIQKEDKPKLIL